MFSGALVKYAAAMRCVRLFASILLAALWIFRQEGVLAEQRQKATGFSEKTSPAATSPAGEPLDINTASRAELRALPGMGEVYVRRVMEGRPYTAKNQLFSRGVLPQTAYEGIRDRIVAHRPPR